VRKRSLIIKMAKAYFQRGNEKGLGWRILGFEKEGRHKDPDVGSCGAFLSHEALLEYRILMQQICRNGQAFNSSFAICDSPFSIC